MIRTSLARRTLPLLGTMLVITACSGDSQRTAQTPSYAPPPPGYATPGYSPAPYAAPGYAPSPYGQTATAPPNAYPAPYGPPPANPYPQTAPPPNVLPPAAPAPAPIPTPPAPAPTAAGAGSLPAAPYGTFDATGNMTDGFLRQEPAAILAELVANLAPASRARVNGIPLKVIDDPKEVNAFAGCDTNGAAYMGITMPLIAISAGTSEARSFDELYGTHNYDGYASSVATLVRGGQPVPLPTPGFLPPPQALDPRKLARQRFLFDEQLGFVLGHELAHHYLGHTGCANGGVSNGAAINPQDVARALSHAVPLLNQPNEIAADVNGTYSVLDTGSRRNGGRFTEEGALMTLDFFSRLQSLGIDTLLLGFLATHPPSQLRLPIVQNAAQQWRANGGKAPPPPFGISIPGFGG